MSKTIRVVAAIIVHDGKVFATQRGYGEWKDGWEFPGGKLEPGESAKDAIVREIREELDAEITVKDLLTTVEYDYPEFHLSMDCFTAELVPGTSMKLLEHEAAKWLAYEELGSVDWLPADVLVTDAIRANREKVFAKADAPSVNWGILGTANIARWATIPGMKKAKGCRLYAIAGRSLTKAEAYKTEFGFEKAYGSYDELLADENVQAVYIPLPNDLHLPWVKKALEAGKHVLCEKPLAMNAAEAKEMFLTAEQNGVYLMEAYAYLHSPFIESLKQDIANGMIGDVDYIDTAFVTQGYKEDFRLHKEHGGGAMYDLGCYCTTMILSLIDSDVADVKAVAEFTDLGVDMLAGVILRFENGVRASFNVGMNLGTNTNSRYDRLYIHGSKGSIRSAVEYNQEGNLSYTIYNADGVTERNIFAPQNYALETSQLNRCILYGETPHITKEFSVKNAELIDRILAEIGY